MAAMGPNGADQFFSARHNHHAFRQTLRDHGFRQPFQQRNTTAQRRFKIQFAAHGPFSHVGNLGFNACIIGQLINAFNGDHGGIHIRHNQRACPMCRLLHDCVRRGESAFHGRAHIHRVASEINIQCLSRLDPAGRQHLRASLRHHVCRSGNITCIKILGCYERRCEHGIVRYTSKGRAHRRANGQRQVYIGIAAGRTSACNAD